jgi:hypothetical protein
MQILTLALPSYESLQSVLMQSPLLLHVGHPYVLHSKR